MKLNLSAVSLASLALLAGCGDFSTRISSVSSTAQGLTQGASNALDGNVLGTPLTVTSAVYAFPPVTDTADGINGTVLSVLLGESDLCSTVQNGNALFQGRVVTFNLVRYHFEEPSDGNYPYNQGGIFADALIPAQATGSVSGVAGLFTDGALANPGDTSVISDGSIQVSGVDPNMVQPLSGTFIFTLDDSESVNGTFTAQPCAALNAVLQQSN